jgi:hypothetical protein
MKKLNQFSSVLAIGLAGLAQLGCDDGGSDGNSAGKGGGSGAAGASGTGGASGAGAAGGSGGGSGFGGSAGGGAGGTSGASGAGGGSGVELVNIEGWVGGDPAVATDNPLGIQGAWYAYGDNQSCTIPANFNPCTSGKCCLEGMTKVDSTFAAWGCGLGLELNASGDTDAGASVKRAFAGTARTFTAVISGTSGGNPVRINFTQEADTANKVSPYKQIAPVMATVTESTSFADAVYPTWCDTNAGCMGKQGMAAKPDSSFDIQFQIPGGELAGNFNFCIESLKVSP